MWSFKRVAGATLLAAALTVPLAACTGLRPVYSEAGLGAERIEVAFAQPRNRLEQVIYNDLSLRLGKGVGDVPLVTVSASTRTHELTEQPVSSPVRARQVIVSANISVTAPDGTALFSGTRSQSADYNTDSQALSNEAALDAAAQQAARLLADTIRLEVIAALAK
ncbi:MAG TPA: LPS assembly lipoprotein LptE [Devosia sp.]|jgi:hypothetical protein|nr:LPS assembly lipoprotein LptE [Devosia sp.]